MSAVSGRTAVAGIIGWPVEQSRSPAIHNAAFAATGLDWIYVAFPVPPGDAPRAVDGMRSLGIRGLNVTMPHKQAVIEALDALTPDAERVDAVNTIVARDGRLTGDNTDGRGFLRALAADAGMDPAGVTALVLGAGGAARAVVAALAGAGAKQVLVAARRPEQAAALAGGAIATLPFEAGAIADAAAASSLVVNATPIGAGGEDPPFPPETLTEGHVVVDLVYHPEVTPFVRIARERTARVFNGLGMLVHQAALSFEAWTGVAAPVDVMRAAVH